MILLQVGEQFITDAYLVPIAIRKNGCLPITSTEETDLSSMAISISRRLTAAGNFGDYAAGCVGDEEDVVAVGQTLDHRHREANFCP